MLYILQDILHIYKENADQSACRKEDMATFLEPNFKDTKVFTKLNYRSCYITKFQCDQQFTGLMKTVNHLR